MEASMNIFKRLWVWLFGDSSKAATQALIQVMAAESFKNNKGLAKKVLPLLTSTIDLINYGSFASYSVLDSYLSTQLAALQLEPAELAVMQLMISNMKTKIADAKIPINNMD